MNGCKQAEVTNDLRTWIPADPHYDATITWINK